PFRIVTGVYEQLGLLGRERPQAFFQEQMKSQTNAGERRFKLVTDRGHEIALHLVQEAKARYVLELHGRPEGVAVRITDRQNVWQKELLLSARVQDEHPFKPLGEIGTLVRQRVRKGLTDGFGRLPR